MPAARGSRGWSLLLLVLLLLILLFVLRRLLRRGLLGGLLGLRAEDRVVARAELVVFRHAHSNDAHGCLPVVSVGAWISVIRSRRIVSGFSPPGLQEIAG